MTVRFGINPLTWTNDDMPELGGDTPLEVCLTEARQAGFEGVELGNKFPRDPAVLGPILASHGLSLVSGWYSGSLLTRSPEEELSALDAHFRLLSALGSNVMVFAETTGAVHCDRGAPLSTRPKLGGDDWRRFGKSLTAVAGALASRGMRLAYHHHMGTVIESEEEVHLLMSNTGPSVGLLLDTGHMTYAGGEPVRVARTHGARIAHVHAKDIRAPVLARVKEKDAPFLSAVLDGVFTVPGDGAVDYPAVFTALAAAGYQGWVVVEAEQDPAKAHPLTYARMGHANVTRFAEACGLR